MTQGGCGDDTGGCGYDARGYGNDERVAGILKLDLFRGSLRAVMLFGIISFVFPACTVTPDQYEVISVNNSQLAAGLLSELPADTANKALGNACMNWNLEKPTVKAFFQHSKILMTAREYHHDFDELPCTITGIIKLYGNTYNFEINAASKAILSRGEEIIYMGCSDKACQNWSLISPAVKALPQTN